MIYGRIYHRRGAFLSRHPAMSMLRRDTANRRSRGALSSRLHFTKSYADLVFVHAFAYYYRNKQCVPRWARQFDRRLGTMAKRKKTLSKLRKPEVRLTASTNVQGRYPRGLCATVLSNGQILMDYSYPNGTVTPGYVAVALGSNFKRSGNE